MSLVALVLLAQLTAVRSTGPVLALPESGLDDSAAYQGYTTRFYRDAAGNAVQVYLDRRQGRVVHVLADAENESIGFSVRAAGAGGRDVAREVPIEWDGESAEVSRRGRARELTYRLVANAPSVDLGWFLLGSMRVERDFQYWGVHRAPLDSTPFTLAENERLLRAIGGLPASTRSAHLAFLHARDTAELRRRFAPTILAAGARIPAVFVQPSLDGRDTLALQLLIDPAIVQLVPQRSKGVVRLRARSGNRVAFGVRIVTTGGALTPLTRDEIFSRDFLDFVGAARDSANRSGDGRAILRARWLERNVRGVELLSSHEKLMAGLPTYATYFGRDMLVSALMMRAIWRPEMSEFAVGAALRKLSPDGQVSHEEALGGQADREAASEYASLVDAWQSARRRNDRAAADSLLARAGAVLRDHRRVRENYHMIDDELQLPVLAGRWLADSNVSADRKRAFLADSSDGGGPRVTRLVRELALVARITAPYAAGQSPANLISFPNRDSTSWASASWRDSNAGYGGGRYAMDVNAVWAPHALESVGRILAVLRALGYSADSLVRLANDAASDTPLGRYARDSVAVRSAVEAWRGAWRHFVVRLAPAELRAYVDVRLGAMPAEERAHWRALLDSTRAGDDSLTFLALSLDAAGQPIGIANSDPSTRLFLGDGESGDAPLDSAAADHTRRDVRLFVRAYPVGLLISGVGPVVANDAYAAPAVWQRFERDAYHGPRVVWGREVNLFLLGVARHIAVAERSLGRADGSGSALATELRAAVATVRSAVEASGFRSELWSYDFRFGRPVPIRYGSGGDVQLWSTTDLAVEYALSRLRP